MKQSSCVGWHGSRALPRRAGGELRLLAQCQGSCRFTCRQEACARGKQRVDAQPIVLRLLGFFVRRSEAIEPVLKALLGAACSSLSLCICTQVPG